MAELSMSNTLTLDSLDPVEAVLKTDEDFAKAIAAAEAGGSFNEAAALSTLEEAGDIMDTEDDKEVKEEELDESTFDVTNPVDLSMMMESSDDGEEDGKDECCDEAAEAGDDYDFEDDFDYDDEDSMMVDEVMEEAGSDPGSAEDKEDGDIIDAVDDDKVDGTGYQVEDTMICNPFATSLFESDIDDEECCTKDATDMSDDDDEAINEDDPFEV